MAGVSFFLVAINSPPKIKSETRPAPATAMGILRGSTQCQKCLNADTTSTEGKAINIHQYL